VAGCLGVVSRRGEVFVRFFVSGLGLNPKAFIITVVYGLVVMLPTFFLVFLMFITFFRCYGPRL
jgi:hypothetical protein